VLAGDTAAFENIVRRWQGPLVNLAYRFCRDRGRAEDMAQEAFLRAFRGLASWRRDAAFSTWLFALATNLYRTELRRIPVNTLPLRDVTSLKEAQQQMMTIAPARCGTGGAHPGSPGGYSESTTLTRTRYPAGKAAPAADADEIQGCPVSHEEIDRALSTDGTILPSSGFASSVMEAVRRDKEMPPPIPFPWKRARPGFIVCPAAVAVLPLSGGVEVQINAGVSWILVALLVAALSVVLSLRLAGRKL
jgi:RNA polymerase sigma factor (sigma-70 family)